MSLIPIVVAGALVGLVAAAGGGGRASPGGASTGEPASPGGLQELEHIMGAAGLPEDWRIFLAAIAHRESKWHSNVGLGPNDHPGRPPWLRPSKSSARLQRGEAAAACSAYRSNYNRRFRQSPWPEERYCFGSGGYFGMLPAYGVINGFYATPEMIPEVDPWAVADPIPSVVMAVGFARGLMRWRQFQQGGGTFAALAIGWGRPARMRNARTDHKRRQSFARHLRALGVDPSFMDRKVPHLNLPKGGHLLALIYEALDYREVA